MNLDTPFCKKIKLTKQKKKKKNHQCAQDKTLKLHYALIA